MRRGKKVQEFQFPVAPAIEIKMVPKETEEPIPVSLPEAIPVEIPAKKEEGNEQRQYLIP